MKHAHRLYLCLTAFACLPTAACLRAPGAPQQSPAASRPSASQPTEAVHKALGFTFAVTLDCSEAPDLKAWGEKAKSICEEQYPVICEMLNSEGFEPSRKITIIFRTSMSVPASTSRSVITVNADYLRKHLEEYDDYGMMVHELVHVVQAYPQGQPNMGWLTEGLADYIRFYTFEPGADKTVIDLSKASYTDSYRTTAAFLNYLVEYKNKDIINRLNTLMREGTCTCTSFKPMLGMGVDEAWKDFVAWERKRRAEAQ